MEGGPWKVFPCCPCVQGGHGGPLRLYGVLLLVSAMGDEDVGGCQLVPSWVLTTFVVVCERHGRGLPLWDVLLLV